MLFTIHTTDESNAPIAKYRSVPDHLVELVKLHSALGNQVTHEDTEMLDKAFMQEMQVNWQVSQYMIMFVRRSLATH